jgi:Short C-terminal domain
MRDQTVFGHRPPIRPSAPNEPTQGPIANIAADNPKYTKLMNLKNMLDGGVITQAEFDAEKAKILGQP